MAIERLPAKRAPVIAAEALAIGLGVFLSLWADEWRTSRNEAAESRESLERLALNLSEDTATFARVSALTERSVESIRSLLAVEALEEEAPREIASLIPYTLESHTLIPNAQEYDALVGSGQLGLIASSELLRTLALYYLRQDYLAELFRLDVQQSHETARLLYPHVEFPRDMFTPETRPATSTTGTPSFFPVPSAAPSVVQLLEDPVFVNEMTYMGLLKQLAANALSELGDLADESLEMIDEELGR